MPSHEHPITRAELREELEVTRASLRDELTTRLDAMKWRVAALILAANFGSAMVTSLLAQKSPAEVVGMAVRLVTG